MVKKTHTSSRRDLPPLNALRAFEAAARLRSVTRAAAELHVTHGAVSRQIRALEEALGQPLFAREGRGLSLTATGTRLHDAAGNAFGQLRDRWAQLRAPRAGPLVLGCAGSVLARWMIPRLDRLARDLPDVPLHLAAQEHLPDADLSGLDAALLLAAPPWPKGWRAELLAPERIGPVLSPRHADWATRKRPPLATLRSERLLHTDSRPQAWPDWARAMRLKPNELTMGQAFPHLYFLLEAAVAGLGVAIAPEPLVADDLAAGRLVAPWGFVATQASWVLVTPRRRANVASDALAKWLRAELDADRYR